MTGQEKIAKAIREFGDRTAGYVRTDAMFYLIAGVMGGLEEIGDFDREAFLKALAKEVDE